MKTIQGLRPNPDVQTPQFVDPFPPPRACQWINFDVLMINMPGYEFGYVAIDGGFRSLMNQGIAQGETAIAPNTTLDFAVHQIGVPASQRASFTEGQFPAQPGQPIDPAMSVEPVVSQPYFRTLQLFFDHDSNPNTQPGIVVLTTP